MIPAGSAKRVKRLSAWAISIFVPSFSFLSCLSPDTNFHPLSRSGITITALAADTFGLADTARATLTNKLVSGIALIPGQTALFQGTVSPDTLDLDMSWDFGDGTTSSNPTGTHAYGDPGTYRAIFSARDVAGFTIADTVTVIVSKISGGAIRGIANYEGRIPQEGIKVTFRPRDQQASRTTLNVDGQGVYSKSENFTPDLYTVLFSDEKFNAFEPESLENVSVTEGKLTQLNPVGLKYRGRWETLYDTVLAVGSQKNTFSLFDGMPYVASRFSTNTAIVKNFENGSWKPVGQPVVTGVNNGVSSSILAMTVCKAGTFLAFDQNIQDGKTKVYRVSVLRLSGDTWDSAGQFQTKVGLAYLCLVSSKDAPFLAFMDMDGYQIKVMRFDGAQWIALPTAGLPNSNVLGISLALDGDVPYVAFPGVNGTQASIFKFNGTVWEQVGATGFPGIMLGLSTPMSLAIEGHIPYVAFQDGANGRRLSVLRFVEPQWEQVGSLGFSAGEVFFMSLAFDNGSPCVVYGEAGSSMTAVKCIEGKIWIDIGRTGELPGPANYLSLTFQDRIPYLGIQTSEKNEFKVMTFK